MKEQIKKTFEVKNFEMRGNQLNELFDDNKNNSEFETALKEYIKDNETEENGKSILIEALNYTNANKEVIGKLIDCGAKIKSQAFTRLLSLFSNIHRHHTPLSLAVALQREDIVDLIIAKDKTIINYPTKDGLTALHFASTETITQTLLDNGADTNIKDSYQRTPLERLKQYNHQKGVEVINNYIKKIDPESKKQEKIKTKLDTLTKRQEAGKKVHDSLVRADKAVNDRLESSVAPIEDKNTAVRLAKKTARVANKTAHLVTQTGEMIGGLAYNAVASSASAINKRRIAGNMKSGRKAGLTGNIVDEDKEKQLRKEAINEGISAALSFVGLGVTGTLGVMSAGGAAVAMAPVLAAAHGTSSTALAAAAAHHAVGGALGHAGATIAEFSNTLVGQAIFNAPLPVKLPYLIFKTKFATPEEMAKSSRAEDRANFELANAGINAKYTAHKLPTKSQYLIALQKELKAPLIAVGEASEIYQVQKDDSNPLVKALYEKIELAENKTREILESKGLSNTTLSPQERSSIRKEVVRQEFERVRAELVEKRMHDAPMRGGFVKKVDKILSTIGLESSGELHSQDSREQRLLRAVATYQDKADSNNKNSAKYAKELIARIDHIYPHDFQGTESARKLKEELKNPSGNDNFIKDFYKEYVAESNQSLEQKLESLKQKVIIFAQATDRTKKDLMGKGSSELTKLSKAFNEEIDRLYPAEKPQEVEKLQAVLIKDNKGKTHKEVKGDILEASKTFLENIHPRLEEKERALEDTYSKPLDKVIEELKEKFAKEAIQKNQIIKELSHNIAVKLFGENYTESTVLKGSEFIGAEKSRVKDKAHIEELLKSSFEDIELPKGNQDKLTEKLSKHIKDNLTEKTMLGILTGGIQLKKAAFKHEDHLEGIKGVIKTVHDNGKKKAHTDKIFPPKGVGNPSRNNKNRGIN